MAVGSWLIGATLEQAPRKPGAATHSGVDCRDWPCGQNPGRQPEGRQRASAREAMSLGVQSSTCRASTFGYVLRAPNSASDGDCTDAAWRVPPSLSAKRGG